MIPHANIHTHHIHTKKIENVFKKNVKANFLEKKREIEKEKMINKKQV